ncbi:bacteriocin-like protein [Chryseobacterium indologenes]|uniref:bacteriocin-like protein n=1 Tax=Chryseobacterium indologenes TaxID=253 RepID=UPI003D356C6D
MKKVLTQKKVSRENLKKIQGAGPMICCAVVCSDPTVCAVWTQLPAKCPESPDCV